MNYLVLLSGGLDSTAALIKLKRELKEGDRIKIVHILYKNSNNNWIPELHCTITAAKKLNIMIDSIINIHASKSIIPRNVFYRLFGNLIGSDMQFNRLVIGSTKTDDINNNVHSPVFGEAEDNIGRWDVGKKIADILETCLDVQPLEVHRPVVMLTKKECADLIPNDIPYFSCGAPSIVDWKVSPCGECSACVEYKENGIELKPIFVDSIPVRRLVDNHNNYLNILDELHQLTTFEYKEVVDGNTSLLR